MANKLIRIRPVTGMLREVRVSGSAVIVKSGAWPTHRLHWEPPTAEPAREDTSEPLVDGRAYLHPGGKFTSFWIAGETTQRTVEDLVLQVVDETPLLAVLNQARESDVCRVIANSTTAPIAPGAAADTLVYADQVWTPTTALADTDRPHFFPGRRIGGGASADVPFSMRAYARLTTQNGSTLVPLAEWTCDVLDALNGRYGCSFEYGGRPFGRAGVVNTASALNRLAWPLYGMAIYCNVPGAGAPTVFEYSVLSIGK